MPSDDSTSRVPAGLRAAGKALYRSVSDHYELDEHEAALLLEAARTTDQLALLDTAVRRNGVLIETPQGQRAHPALVEARGQRITLARLIAALRLPQGEEGDRQASARPQRRSGARGTYGIKGVVS